MEKVYTVCILVGLILPAVCLIFDLFGNATEAIGLSIDVDIGDFELSMIPTSSMSVCAWSLVFGTVGKIMGKSVENGLIVAIVALIVGYIIAILVQTLIKHLKKVDNLAPTEEDILKIKGNVVLPIVENGYGTVIFTVKGCAVSYPAKSIDGSYINQNESVIPVRFEGRTLVVKNEKEK